MRNKRCGGLTIEITIAMIVLGAAILTVGQTVGLVGVQQRASFERMVAGQEAANVMETVLRAEWSENDDSERSAQLSSAAAEQLREARLQVDVSDPQPDGARRVTVEVRWSGRNGRGRDPVRLVAWRYPDPARADQAATDEDSSERASE